MLPPCESPKCSNASQLDLPVRLVKLDIINGVVVANTYPCRLTDLDRGLHLCGIADNVPSIDENINVGELLTMEIF